MISPGTRVKVNRDDPEWGRIAEEGTVVSWDEHGMLVAIGGTIRADVFCEHDEVTQLEDP